MPTRFRNEFNEVLAVSQPVKNGATHFLTRPGGVSSWTIKVARKLRCLGYSSIIQGALPLLTSTDIYNANGTSRNLLIHSLPYESYGDYLPPVQGKPDRFYT